MSVQLDKLSLACTVRVMSVAAVLRWKEMVPLLAMMLPAGNGPDTKGLPPVAYSRMVRRPSGSESPSLGALASPRWVYFHC